MSQQLRSVTNTSLWKHCNALKCCSCPYVQNLDFFIDFLKLSKIIYNSERIFLDTLSDRVASPCLLLKMLWEDHFFILIRLHVRGSIIMILPILCLRYLMFIPMDLSLIMLMFLAASLYIIHAPYSKKTYKSNTK